MPASPEERLYVALAPRTPEVEAIAARLVVELAADLRDPETLELLVDAAEKNDAVPSGEVVQRAGISYRQLHYWTSAGLVTPLERKGESSGFRLAYPSSEVVKARIMGILVKPPWEMTPGSAAGLAAEIIENGSAEHGGFRLTKGSLG
jgi:hypothetical protein